MIAENLDDNWYAQTKDSKIPEGQRVYSDQAILICLQIRYLFGLKLRQSQGFVNWIFKISGLQIACPDYSTLSRRGKKLNLESLLHDKNTEFDYASIYSTGIRAYIGNEWLENKHGNQYMRRIWKETSYSCRQ
jgi:hypothetical protein